MLTIGGEQVLAIDADAQVIEAEQTWGFLQPVLVTIPARVILIDRAAPLGAARGALLRATRAVMPAA